MGTHSSILACRIPWTEEPGGPWSCKELDMTEQQFLFSISFFNATISFFNALKNKLRDVR